VPAIRSRAVVLIDPGLEHLDDERRVLLALALAELRIVPGIEFVDALSAAIVDTDHDEFESTRLRQLIQGLVNAPLTGVRGRIVEQILPVVHVQHGIAARTLLIARRQINAHGALTVQARNKEGRRQYMHVGLRGARLRRGGGLIGPGREREQTACEGEQRLAGVVCKSQALR